MDMNSIRRRNLRAIIDAWPIATIAQFSRDTGIDEARLSQVLSEKYREGNNFGEKAARSMEKLAGLPPLSLDKITETDLAVASAPRGKLDAVSERKQAFDQNVTPVAMGKRAIPVISAIQAGALKEMVDPYPSGAGYAVEYADDDFSRWAFALTIEGESMLPEFRPGDRVLIEPGMAPNPGDFVIAKNGSQEATFKKYRPRGIDEHGDIIFELVPLNEDYPTMRSDATPLQVIGVMVEHRRRTRRR
jgi:SOS-response transcriptional repressor LexA